MQIYKGDIMTKKTLSSTQIIKIMIAYIKNQNPNIQVAITDNQIAQFADKLVQLCNQSVGQNYMTTTSNFCNLKTDMECFAWAYDSYCQYVFYNGTSVLKEYANGFKSMYFYDTEFLSADEINTLYKNSKHFDKILGLTKNAQNDLSM